MCDNFNASYTLQSSIVIWALSLIPSGIFPYVILAMVCASLVIYAAHRIRPSTRLSRLNDALAGATEILARAKSECLHDQLDLVDEEGRLLQVKLSASKIQTHLLEARNASWEIYLPRIRAVCHSLDSCERQVREIQTSTLLIIEAENQRKLAEHINESRGIVNTVLRSPRHNRRFNQPSRGLELNEAIYRLQFQKWVRAHYVENHSVEVGERQHQLISGPRGISGGTITQSD
ncbi:hypothetical protein FB451DRAFT_1464874 [Mycena latifolia]|nr:hypothetical protein FB451DRAFT_1464874 [Mycena latifolia]